MSPLSLRRHRAERALREQFEALRGQVLANVRGRLRANGVRLDRGDLEACYSMAWQGLYTKLLEGEEIANPEGWLVLVTHRRALDEHRARARTRLQGELGVDGLPVSGPSVSSGRTGDAEVARVVGAGARDLAEELDDRARLRQLFEGLRGRLDAREREAAALCYLQGLSRAQAAAHMGVSEARMRKLMEGRGPGRPGVAAKVGALVHTIRDGGWCEEQGSLMRALAYGVLDPAGERHRLALMHSSQCPACRAYVVSLRGLAVALPPVFAPAGLAAAVLAGVGEGVHSAALSAAGGAHGGLQAGRAAGGVAPGSGAGGVAPPSGAGGVAPGSGVAGVAPASGVAGASAAGAGGAASGGWLLGAGSLGAKLAAGCVLALGVGAGCAVLSGGHRPTTPHPPRRVVARAQPASAAGSGRQYDYAAAATGLPGAIARGGATSSAAATSLTPAAKASREFGPEQALASESPSTAPPVDAPATARAASSRSSSRHSHGPAGGPSGSIGGEAAGGRPTRGDSGGVTSAAPSGEASGMSTPTSSSADSASAEREFSPG